MESKELVELFNNITKNNEGVNKPIGVGILLGLKEVAEAFDRFTEQQRKALLIEKKMLEKQEELVERLEEIEDVYEEDNPPEDNESEEGENWRG